METITSPKNDHIKLAKKLTVKKYQKDYDRYLLEGPHQVHDALAAGAQPDRLYVTSKYAQDREFKEYYNRMTEITADVEQHLSSTQSPQGVFGVFPLPHNQLPKQLHGSFLLLDGIQDPGNVGTMVRTADAAGVQNVVLGKQTADAFSPKVLRAMQGSQFHVNIVSADLTKLVPQLQRSGVPVYGTELNDQAKPYASIAKTDNFALIMGNEGNGMRPELLARTDVNIYIPMRGNAESLNVGVAAGVVLFHLLS
ncbi:TrmH family RNA methyltransferase [Lacticaseibacillus songhuajiangensis]|jgi:TrmH family RNA methyltransferase|uniref:TrmH family RNA methyltransferase n=1 Tax=Lacticaseibacillus songhuajiangensis TaxID=1296539 RepID=UPI000F7B96F1|nr:RNA methyltransferase [Lacticaseibacillus songhuajiangensis]MCI1284088.1 RNA methyltransferase [Lacticaseibacillus songhuajiangensis]